MILHSVNQQQLQQQQNQLQQLEQQKLLQAQQQHQQQLLQQQILQQSQARVLAGQQQQHGGYLNVYENVEDPISQQGMHK